MTRPAKFTPSPAVLRALRKLWLAEHACAGRPINARWREPEPAKLPDGTRAGGGNE